MGRTCAPENLEILRSASALRSSALRAAPGMTSRLSGRRARLADLPAEPFPPRQRSAYAVAHHKAHAASGLVREMDRHDRTMHAARLLILLGEFDKAEILRPADLGAFAMRAIERDMREIVGDI